MSRNLCLTRQCLGLVTRIECSIRPLAGDTGMWTLLFAAGMAGEQPSAIKAQGPFHGPFVAESILNTIVGDDREFGKNRTLSFASSCNQFIVFSMDERKWRKLFDKQIGIL